jgi:hypothetical protein
VSVANKKCLIEVDYNFKMFNRTRLKLDSLVTLDMILSYNWIRLIVLH